MAACHTREPIRLGFIGGLSGRVADLGIGGRDGALLAVELRNTSGGVGGRQLELIAEDDQQATDIARQAVARLIDNKVTAIIGPMTSAMAVATVPLANTAQLLMLSPTVTTTDLAGMDDYFLRVINSTTNYASKSANYHFAEQGSRRISVTYDLRNQAYAESWLNDYRKEFEAAGGALVAVVPFSSSDDSNFSALAQRLLQPRPDGVLILANSVDTAMLAQQVRKRDAVVHINASEWSATERLIELGGKAVEGIVIAQFIDRESQQASYMAFKKAYLARFKREPGFAGLLAFDATNVVLDGLAAQTSGQTLKQAILARREFAGAQSRISFDAYGDAVRDTYLTTVRHGAFVRLQ
ncbi:ABC transporter substrate-binding protein [Rhodoferax sp.]|uniref:ABC transporter substrate-binding protein n=1 Tax=Rhodoferax sp. TaxID=50421 RepID=UPI0025F0A328|nr:ABC transporter substrate-binding protein [Rhodoferax sp.]MCM2297282.1 ABC transporter substrate-binding protein [Rhodoferax sp.]